MSRRSSLCLAAAASCCCLALLVESVHGGRVTTGLLGTSSGGRDHRLSHEPQFHGAHQVMELQRGATMKARPSWSLPSPPQTPLAAGRVRAELRLVPGGPDPLHHHGSSPWRPEQEKNAAP